MSTQSTSEMQIVVNHVTRMRKPRICVAGIDTTSLSHVRPTTSRADPITRDLLRPAGGPFAPGALVDLGSVVPQGSPPEIEDHRFFTRNAKHVRDLSADEYLGMLDAVKSASIEDAFGPEMHEIRPGKLALPKGRGRSSLAVIELHKPRVHIEWDKLYIDIDDGVFAAKLRITDVRFYDQNEQVRTSVVEDVTARLRRRTKAYGMLGVGHPLLDRETGELHWLQCNGLCLADRATGAEP